jgi:hypothetical protein
MRGPRCRLQPYGIVSDTSPRFTAKSPFAGVCDVGAVGAHANIQEPHRKPCSQARSSACGAAASRCGSSRANPAPPLVVAAAQLLAEDLFDHALEGSSVPIDGPPSRSSAAPYRTHAARGSGRGWPRVGDTRTATGVDPPLWVGSFQRNPRPSHVYTRDLTLPAVLVRVPSLR